MSTILSRLLYVFIIINLFVRKSLNLVKILDKGVASLERNSVGLQFYFDIENEDRNCACTASSFVKKCCLTSSAGEDCHTMFVSPDDGVNIAPKERVVIISVYPTVYQHDLAGYCNFDLRFQCGRRKKAIPINIPFDTRLEKIKKTRTYKSYVQDFKVDSCESLDENPLDECEPVDCNKKYLDGRSFFDESKAECVGAPICIYDFINVLPNLAYHPDSNTCRDLNHVFSSSDVFLITSGSGIVKKPVKPVRELEVVLKSNCTTISEKLRFIRDMMVGNMCATLNAGTNDTDLKADLGSSYVQNISSIALNIIVVSAVVIAVVFCCSLAVMFYRILSCKNFVIVMEDFRMKVKSSMRKDRKKKKRRRSGGASEATEKTKSALIREIMNRDVPIELRHSALDLCEKMEMKIKEKEGSRSKDVSSHVVIGDKEETFKDDEELLGELIYSDDSL